VGIGVHLESRVGKRSVLKTMDGVGDSGGTLLLEGLGHLVTRLVNSLHGDFLCKEKIGTRHASP